MSTRKDRTLLSRIRRLFNRHPNEQDPYARVRVPLKKGPGGLRAGVALEEPRE